MRIVVAGSSGLVGSALVPALEAAGHEVERLVRPGGAGAGIPWDPAAGHDRRRRPRGGRRRDQPGGAQHRGAPLGRGGAAAGLGQPGGGHGAPGRGPWPGCARPPAVLLNASAVGFYGHRPGERLDESSAAGHRVLPRVVRRLGGGHRPGRRGRHPGGLPAQRGGALAVRAAPWPACSPRSGPAWLSPYRWGLGGWLGDGSQVWSWISLEDEVRAIVHLLGSDLAGPVNLTAPEPVDNKRFVKAVGKALRRPVWLPIPRLVPRLAAGPRPGRPPALRQRRGATRSASRPTGSASPTRGWRRRWRRPLSALRQASGGRVAALVNSV